jgi:hypothetical protein
MAQVMPEPGAEPPNTLTNRISPSGLKHAAADGPAPRNLQYFQHPPGEETADT